MSTRRQFFHTTIAAFVAGAARPGLAQRGGGPPIVEQTEYWAHPGKADEVYQWRLHACDVRQQIGLPRGRVLRRQGESESLPDVIWQIEYPDDAAKQNDLKVRDESPAFRAVRDRMQTLYRRFERGFWSPE